MNKTLRQGRLNARTLFVGLVLITLSGCASTMDELVSEAIKTGDWSLVNERQNVLASTRQQNCGARETLYCETRLNTTNCSCVADTALWQRPDAMTHRQRGDRY